MALTISTADPEDGVNLDVTLAGFGGAADVSVYRMTGGLGNLAPLFVFPGVDCPGTTTLPLSKGYWLLLARNGADGSPPHYAQVSDGEDPVAWQVRDAIKERIELLALPGIQGVHVQMTPDETNVTFPCVIITPWDLSNTAEQNLSGLDDWGRPNRVWCCDRQSPIDHRVQRQFDGWEQAIARAFHNQQLPTPRTCVRCMVEPDYIINPNLPKFQYLVNETVIRVTTREPRGLGA